MKKVTIQNKENYHQGPEVKEEGSIRPDCEAPESTVLLFAEALKTNAGNEVKAAIQDIVLYLDPTVSQRIGFMQIEGNASATISEDGYEIVI